MLNSDSLRCIQVIAGVLGRAGESGQQKRLEAAKTGVVTWLPPPGLGKPVTEEDRRKAVETKETEKKAIKPDIDEVIPSVAPRTPQRGRFGPDGLDEEL